MSGRRGALQRSRKADETIGSPRGHARHPAQQVELHPELDAVTQNEFELLELLHSHDFVGAALVVVMVIVDLIWGRARLVVYT